MRTIPIVPVSSNPHAVHAAALHAVSGRLPTLVKGRGTSSQMAHRFSSDVRRTEDDGWGDQLSHDDGVAAPTKTLVLEEHVKTILAGNDSPDIGFDLSINPYRVSGQRPHLCPNQTAGAIERVWRFMPLASTDAAAARQCGC